MKIAEVLDVGANTGQFGALLRRSGFRGRIISFEPLGSAFRALVERAEGDAEWFCYEVGLAEKPGERILNVSANSFSSSFLGMAPRHLSAAPDSGYVGTELVSVTTLDEIGDLLDSANGYRYLKIDTQGYELQVLGGARHLLSEVSAIETEVSLVQLYDDQDLFTSVIEYVDSKGFHLSGLYPGYCDPSTGDMLQMDALFLRKENKG